MSSANDPLEQAKKELAQAHLALAAARAVTPLTAWCRQVATKNKASGARQSDGPAPPHAPSAKNKANGARRTNEADTTPAPAKNKAGGARRANEADTTPAPAQNKAGGARHQADPAEANGCPSCRDGARHILEGARSTSPAQNKASGARRLLTERQQIAARIVGRNRGTSTAAARVGVNRHTIPRWMRLPEFAQAVEQERLDWNQRRQARLEARRLRARADAAPQAGLDKPAPPSP